MFVGRKQDGTIYGLWTVRQWEGQEELPDNHPDVVAFRDRGENLARAASDSRALIERRIRELTASGTLEDKVAALELKLSLLGGG